MFPAPSDAILTASTAPKLQKREWLIAVMSNDVHYADLPIKTRLQDSQGQNSLFFSMFATRNKQKPTP